MNTDEHSRNGRLAYSVDELARASGLSRVKLYEEINSGALRSFKVGNRRLITPQAWFAFVASRESGR